MSPCSAEEDGAVRGKPCCTAGRSEERARLVSERGLSAGHELLKRSLNRALVMCLLLCPTQCCAAMDHCCSLWNLRTDISLQSCCRCTGSSGGWLPACRSALCWIS